MYHPKVETKNKTKKFINLKQRCKKELMREREREIVVITFFGRECKTNNKII